MEILVRKVDGKIVAVSGGHRLTAKLVVEKQAKVKFLGSGRETIVVKNENGDIVELNSAAQTVLGKTMEKLIEATANDFFIGKDASQTAPISYGELVWLMRNLLSSALQSQDALEPDAHALQQRFEQGFFGGVLVSLQVLHQFDLHVAGTGIVSTVGGIDMVEEHAKQSGSEVDIDTLYWIKTGRRN